MDQMTHVLYERDADVVWLKLNRPEKRNAINAVMVQELLGALQAIAEDPDAKMVVITGVGSAFCAGRDVSELMVNLSDRDGHQRLPGSASKIGNALRSLPQVTIAMVNGPALGEGQDLVLACDLAVAAESATLGDLHFTRGVLPSSGVWILQRVVGAKLAMEYLLLGTKLSAVDALNLRLINRVAPDDRLETEVQQLIAEVRAVPQKSVRYLKRAIQKAGEESLAQSLEFVEYARSVAAKTNEAWTAGEAYFDSARR